MSKGDGGPSRSIVGAIPCGRPGAGIMVLKEQVGWYEGTLPLKERRSRGHFSTPPRLVEHILDACGYTAAMISRKYASLILHAVVAIF